MIEIDRNERLDRLMSDIQEASDERHKHVSALYGWVSRMALLLDDQQMAALTEFIRLQIEISKIDTTLSLAALLEGGLFRNDRLADYLEVSRRARDLSAAVYDSKRKVKH